MPINDGSVAREGYVLYGVRGWGSAIVEAMLVWCGCTYRFEAVEGFEAPGEARERLLKLNPLGQVPALLLPSGATMTETAAIALSLDECFPAAALAPAPQSPLRPKYLRLLVWLVANVYPTFTYGDHPSRWTAAGADELRESTDRYRERLYLELERIAAPREYLLGATPSALDLYVAVLLHWRPGRAWFDRHRPKLAAVGDRIMARPDLAPVFAANFPPAP